MKKLKRVLISYVLIFTFLFFCFDVNIYASSNEPLRVINVVYDDSGSMIESKGVKYDTWCQAKYSMEVFAAMLGGNDIMHVYVMSDYDKNKMASSPMLTLRGTDGAEINVAKVHDMITDAANTPFRSVQKAYSDLVNTTADEKWLVVLTDGEFQYNTTDEFPNDDVDTFFDKKASDVNVMFLGMGAEADAITPDASRNLFFEKAETSSDILNKITEICTRIFNRNKLEVDVSSCKFSFDVPMSELVVFAQGADVKIGNITSGKESYGSYDTPVTVKYHEVATIDTRYKDFKIATDLKGSIATFRGDYNSGDYKVDVTGAETIEIYYKPNIDIAAYLTDMEGNEVTNMETLEEGDYIMTFGFVKAGTNEKVPESKLLGDITYAATISQNGESDGKLYSSGDQVSVKEGTFGVDVTATFLKYNTVSTDLEFTIFRNKELNLELIDSPEYIIDKTGITNANEPMVVKATLEGQELTDAQWAALDADPTALPEVEQVKHRDKRVEFSVVKTDQTGIYHIFPSLPDGKPTIGDYGNIDLGIGMQAKVENETWSGETEGEFQIRDTRSWFEKNIDKVIKLAILLFLLWLLLGYIPPFKKYLPKDLQVSPLVTCKPTKPGKRPQEGTGRYTKNSITTFIPYKAETGTVVYTVGSGGAGLPALEIKAAGGRSIEITNADSFIGKDVSLGGTVLKAPVKKLVKSSAMLVIAKTPDMTYSCKLNAKRGNRK